MDTVGEGDVLMLSVSIFKIVGEGNRHYEDKFIYIFRLINVCTFMWNLIIVLGSVTTANGFVYVKIMESAISCSHGILKYICLIYYKSDIEILLDNLRYFWKTSDVEGVNRKADVIYKYFAIGQKVYLVAAISVMLFYFIRPCFEENQGFIFETWPILNSTIAETFTLFSQYYFLLVCAPVVYAYDVFYLAFALRVIIQLKLLKHTFERVTREDGVKKLYECIKQHQLLLRVFDRMRKVYFWMLLLHYVVTLITGCTHLYIVLIAEAGPFEMVASSIYLWGMFVEFGGYTIPVEEIVFQLKDLSRAVYMSSWYNRCTTERRYLLIVMMKSQRQRYLSAAGLIDMNVNTFGSGILKYICFIYYKSDIEILLDDLRLFWRTNGDEELNRKANLVYKYLSIGQRVYMAAAIVFMLIYIIRPCFDENERFIFASWPILNSTVAETFVLFCQYYILLIFASIVYAYDTFYLAYAFRVIIQLKLLKYTFERVAHDDDAEKLYKCIKQHQLLLCVFDRMRKVYFWMLLLYYGIVLVTSCSELYVALIAQPGPVEVIASVIYLMAMLVEFGGYTILVEEIVFQLKDLSRAVYMSNWYDRRVDVRQDLLIVMMKSQRQKYLSAAGMIEMNVDTLASLKLLKYTFEHVDRDDAVNELHKCIRQHQFLLRVFDRMRKVYFWIMLLHYAITLVTGCTHLYIVLVAEVEPSEMVASVIYLWAVFIEFGGYTIPVEEIVFQLKDLSRATYMSTWYDWSVTERQDLLIIMMKSQRQKYVSAAGLMDMNVDTFGSIHVSH
ncbi:Or19a [Trypoxylus dichotomus]